MNGTVLNVEGVGKAFRRYRSELSRVLTWFGMHAAPKEESWILRDVGFCVEHGEAVAIVGRNGAGKSTLLKIVTGTMRPTTGRVALSGRVAAILELGMGFDPELDARTNAYHVGGLMGYTRAQMDEVMPLIEGFAEVGSYFDKPMRLMSSGMQMRVAFSVATAHRPDVLIVDEALSVGDAYFQHKSMDRIREFRHAGTSLIFVSHDPSAVLALCDRAVLLDGGRVVMDGEPAAVLDLYNALISPEEARPELPSAPTGPAGIVRSGSGEATVVALGFVDENGLPVDALRTGEPACLKVEVRVNRDVEVLVFGFAIRDRVGQTLYGTNTFYSEQAIERPRVGARYRFLVRFKTVLAAGSYSVTTALVSGANHTDANYEWRDHALVFEVIDLTPTRFHGPLYMPATIEVA
ncbi:ABC transporter ATP-binding protein [Salinarimonas ramus]|uniref:Sugar ABC transporter ATP-binding protein n=1 Tax=Salinarimonas ramus TaxID=690164 RepID=A0A917QE54_9HYPH|nr:ABC transporter ATP-binding protein [Salinarimonas ramus]GGK47116.1 sugar ABC transporter ATP-binding protein [Salinarimonas ramus]